MGVDWVAHGLHVGKRGWRELGVSKSRSGAIERLIVWSARVDMEFELLEKDLAF